MLGAQPPRALPHQAAVARLAAGVPELRTAPPLDFDGPGDAWSPEQLLLAAVEEACFLLTFRSVAQAEHACLVAASLDTRIPLEPEIAG